jgi:hypothetical protein
MSLRSCGLRLLISMFGVRAGHVVGSLFGD